MIEYKNGVIIMDLVDLEHCGFKYDDFDFELRVSGIDGPAAHCAVALLVNFAGGMVVTSTTSDETLARMAEARTKFETLREILMTGREQ